MNRRGPAGGYDFGRKRKYRRMVWAALAQAPRGAVAMMPSIEGDEIREAEKRGIPRHSIHVIDRNRAIVAHLQRRYPGVVTYGIDLRRAIERMARRGVVLSAANWDLTVPIGDEVIGIMQATRDVMVAGGLVAVTTLRGREACGWVPMLRRYMGQVGGWWRARVARLWVGDRGMGATDHYRLMLLQFAIGIDCDLVKAGSYRSTAGSQTMLWSVWRVRALQWHWERSDGAMDAELRMLHEDIDRKRRGMSTRHHAALARLTPLMDRALREQGSRLRRARVLAHYQETWSGAE